MKITVPAFKDMHVHFREEDEVPHLGRVSSQWCDQVLAMPNLKRPLTTWQQVTHYEYLLRERAGLAALVAFYLTPKHTPEDIKELYEHGCTIAKAYPKGRTTHSQHGIEDYQALYPVFDRMQDLDMVLCLHGEKPGSFVLHAERDFLIYVLRPLLEAFPRLRVVLEHITTQAATEFVRTYAPSSRLAATITAHHLFLTLDDVIGPGGLQPRNHCMPTAKYPQDLWAIRHAAIGDEPCFFLGSDSAPHYPGKKYCDAGCAGVYTAPYLPHYLAVIFEPSGFRHLAAFTSERAQSFYRQPASDRKLVIEPGHTAIPRLLGGYLPFLGGAELPWTAERI